MNLLHLEDNEMDADLFAALLAEEWPDVTIRRMWTRGEFENALQREHFDLILSDHSMPGFDGLTALNLAHSYCPDTPFIFLSGTIGEDRAIEALKRGATDYVLKNAPARLISAVHGALEDAEREAARRAAETSLRKNREQFQQIAESIDDFILLLDGQGRCLYSNPAFSRMLHGQETISGKTIFEPVHAEDREGVRAGLVRALDLGVSVDLEFRVQLLDQSIRHLEACVSLLRQRDQDGSTLLMAGRDVSKRKAAERELHEQASLLGKARDAICLMDLQYTITRWNPSAERIFGRAEQEMLGGNARELLFRDETKLFDAAVTLTKLEREWHGEFRLDRPDGRELILHTSWSLVNDQQGCPQSILFIGTDITSRKQLELELQRSQRMEGLGMLAGGVAHDLNNVLSPILMSVDLLRMFARTDNEKMILDTLAASASHGTDLVKQILLFARGGAGQLTEVRMDRLLAELEGFLKAGIRGINLSLDYDPGLWPIRADATQLKQVLMNLCVNARDAMPGGGRIGIQVANVRVGAGTHHGFHGEIAAGPYVRLSVADTGTGIPPEVQEKIFDPFFTTKPIGKGTGLGLSTIAGIVQHHEGAIRVESVLEQGTTFHIYLPALISGSRFSAQEEPEALPAGNGELVLVIDDDDGIRLIAEQILKTNGYRVITAECGETGLQEVKRRREEIQVVVCDQMMPGLCGREVLRMIHEEAPGIRLIATSGLKDELESLHLPSGEAVTTLAKPLTSAMLLCGVRGAIDASQE